LHKTGCSEEIVYISTSIFRSGLARALFDSQVASLSRHLKGPKSEDACLDETSHDAASAIKEQPT
jgi:hypothetical protein